MEKNPDHSVTLFIEGLRTGDELATQKIWERFFHRLMRLADRKLKSNNRKVADEEDVVLIAFEQFFRQVAEGRFPKLNDRDDLWQVLAMLVDRRAKDQVRHQKTKKKGGGAVRGESIFLEHSGLAGINGMPAMYPTQDFAFELIDEFGQRLEDLDDDSYREIAIMKMEGFTNIEISRKTGIVLRTIERRLEHIRDKWRRGPKGAK